MKTKLFWSAGRFVYTKGSAQLLHFLPFSDFALDDGIDFTRLFAIRALRTKLEDSAFSGERLAEAMKDTAESLVAPTVAELILSLKDGDTSTLSVLEFYPGAGILFEYMKYLLEVPSDNRNDDNRVVLRYRAWGAESYRLKFEVLHGDDSHHISYMPDHNGDGHQLLKTVCESDLVIYNHAESVRHRTVPHTDLTSVLGVSSVPTLIVARVISSDNENQLTTVKGRTLNIPTANHILTLCQDNDPFWQFKYVHGFDAGFMLPIEGIETGLLIGYTARRPLALSGFEAMERIGPPLSR